MCSNAVITYSMIVNLLLKQRGTCYNQIDSLPYRFWRNSSFHWLGILFLIAHLDELVELREVDRATPDRDNRIPLANSPACCGDVVIGWCPVPFWYELLLWRVCIRIAEDFCRFLQLVQRAAQVTCVVFKGIKTFLEDTVLHIRSGIAVAPWPRLPSFVKNGNPFTYSKSFHLWFWIRWLAAFKV